MTDIPVITIDGPSGVGKGTMCRLLAKQLGWHALDSGALYRVLALQAVREQIALTDATALAALVSKLALRFVEGDDDVPHRILLGDEDISQAIRSEECGNHASQIAKLAAVRSALLMGQRAFRQVPGLVTDGRDMGTVVFPDAQLKFFLYASPEERAKRRYAELNKRGIRANIDQLLGQLVARDERDSARAVAPLQAAVDAVLLDSSGLDIDEVLSIMLHEAKRRLGINGNS